MNGTQIVTIGRQFGAGGRSIGKALAASLGVSFYDKDLILEAARASGLSHQLLANMDEQHTGSLLYSLVMNAQGRNLFGSGKPVELLAYEAQIASVRCVAERGPCVIVGRAADCILQDTCDVRSIFVTAPLANRVRHVAQRDGIPEEEAARKIARLDKARASFYNGFSDKVWGEAASYDLCLNLGRLKEADAVELVLQYLSHAR